MNTTMNIIKTFSRAALCLLGVVFLPGGMMLYAELGLPETQPYNFGPEATPISDLRDYGKPSQMTSILPYRPVAARQKDGSRVYFSPTGNMTVRISPDGSMHFTTGGRTISVDAKGNKTGETVRVKGTNRVETKNEKGQITGYQELGYGGQVVREYDAGGNLTRSHVYDKYGKNVQIVLNELSLTKTVFDRYGRLKYDQNFEGAIVARYNYDENHKLKSKKDNYDNTTYFNDKGNADYTEDYKGKMISKYDYKVDDNGRYVLETMTDLESGDVTYFDNGKAVNTRSRLGGVTMEFMYDGTTLRYSFDTTTNEATWYDLNGRVTNSTYNGEVVKQWLYHKGRMVGYYDDYQKTVMMYQNERQDLSVRVFAQNNIPTAADIQKYYESLGLMSDIGATALALDDQSKKVQRKTNLLAPSAQKQADQSPEQAFTVVKDGRYDLQTGKSGLMEVKVNYSKQTGKAEGVVIKTAEDGKGWVTELTVDHAKITVSGSQAKNADLAKELLAKLKSGVNIADISSGEGELADFAKSIKSISMDNRDIKATKEGLCSLFGWNKAGTDTSQYVADIQARMVNAGEDGQITVTYDSNQYIDTLQNYETRGLDTGKRLYAATVAVTDSKGFAVAGNKNNGTILGIGLDTRVGIIYSAQQVKTLKKTGSMVETVGAEPDESALNELSAAYGTKDYAEITTVNGVTKKYASNGNLIEENDARARTRTVYNEFGKRVAVYRLDDSEAGALQIFNYSKGGHLESVVNHEEGVGYMTSFFLGFGNANMGQTEIKVAGDQSKNAKLAASLWDAVVNNNMTINEAVVKNPALKTLAASINKVILNTRDILYMTDKQLTGLMGWNINSPKISSLLSSIRSDAQSGSVMGRLSARYSPTDETGLIFCDLVEMESARNQSNNRYLKAAVDETDAR